MNENDHDVCSRIDGSCRRDSRQNAFDSLRANDFQAGFNWNPERLDKLMAIVEGASPKSEDPMAQMTHGMGRWSCG